MGRDKDLVIKSPGPGSYKMPELLGEKPTYKFPKLVTSTPRTQSSRTPLNLMSKNKDIKDGF